MYILFKEWKKIRQLITQKNKTDEKFFTYSDGAGDVPRLLSGVYSAAEQNEYTYVPRDGTEEETDDEASKQQKNEIFY